MKSSVDEEEIQTEFVDGVTNETVEKLNNEQFNEQTNLMEFKTKELDEENFEENVEEVKTKKMFYNRKKKY